MEWSVHEHCCGAAELGGFGESEYSGHDYTTTQEGFDLAMAGMRMGNRGYVTATTIAEQTSAIRLLRKNKFRVLTRFRNPNTGGTWVTLWGRKL